MSTRIGVCDYGVGNLRSVERALLASGAVADLTAEPDRLESADGLILPGVGAFGTAADALAAHGLDEVVARFAASGRPVLGICLGFQLLFDRSEESGGRDGLGLLGGTVTRLSGAGGKVPHMGWNQLRLRRRSPLLDGIADGAHVYFVHSYAARARDQHDVVAVCDHGEMIAAVCERENVLGTQFHPEKSGRDGLRLYENFVRLCAPQRVTAA